MVYLLEKKSFDGAALGINYNKGIIDLVFAGIDKKGNPTSNTLSRFNTLEDAIEDYKERVLFWQPENQTELRKALKNVVKKEFIYTIDMLKASKSIGDFKATNQVMDDLVNDYNEFKKQYRNL